MRITVPVYRDIEAIFFHNKIEDYLSRTGIIGDVSYNRDESPKDNTILIDWQLENGTIPIFMTDISNPYGIKPYGSLKIEVEGVEDEIPLIRQLMIILNERAIIFPDDEIKTIRDKFEKKRPMTMTIEELDYWNALSNSIRSLERAIYELSKLNQFVHLWRSFNSLYSYIYKKDTGKDPKNTDEQRMFNHFLSCGKIITKQECKELVELFLSKYDLRWLYELKIDTISLAKEGWEELVEKDVVRPSEGETKGTLKEKRVWMFEGVDWEKILSFRKGLEFWERFEKGNYPAALREVVAFVYEVNRNNIFHGGEPFFVEEEIALFQASIEMLYCLLIISIPRISQESM
jgi:hypothetical protein